MTLAPRRVGDEIRRFFTKLFHPDREERERREKAALDVASEVAGTVFPWLFGAAIIWMMISMTTGWNIGLF